MYTDMSAFFTRSIFHWAHKVDRQTDIKTLQNLFKKSSEDKIKNTLHKFYFINKEICKPSDGS